MKLNLSDTQSLMEKIGQEIGTSCWFEIEQPQIDAFGELTKDLDAMHMDANWAKQHSPYGDTIAYGFQTLSMMTAMMNDILPRGSEEAYKLNYGFDRVRLMAPVRQGSRIRGRATIKDLRIRGDGSAILTMTMQVEIENEEKPAVIADWLFLVANDDAEKRRPDMDIDGEIVNQNGLTG